MKTSFRYIRLTLLTAVGSATIFGLASNSSSSAPGGYTGSPADGKTCGTNGGCHGGGATAYNNMITTDIPAEGYTPGTEYNVTVTLAQTGVSKFGFSFSAQKTDGTELGDLTAGSGTNIVATKYMSHKPTTTAGTDKKEWAFKWTAPSAGTGKVNFYAAGNASDGMSNTTGDKIYQGTLEVNEKGGDTTTTSVVEATSSVVKLFPNPAQNAAWMVLEEPETIQLISLSGETVKTFELPSGESKLDISDIDYGVYKVVNATGDINKTLVKL